VLIKLSSLDPFQLCFWRSALALAVLFAVERARAAPRDPAILLASLCYAASLLFFVVATRLTTAASAIFLTYTSPAFVLVLGHFLLGERISRRGALTVFGCLAGMAILLLESHGGAPGLAGNALAVAGGASFALLTVLLRSSRDAEPLGAVVLGNLWVVAIGAAAILVRGRAEPWRDFALGPADAAGVFFLGVFQLGLSYILFARAVGALPALDVALVSSIEPVLNPIWVMLLAGESPSRAAFVGGAIIVFSITAYLSSRRQ